jgi:hypothetical protein
MDIGKLSNEKKMFLAGCIRNLILADGNIMDEELEDLDRLLPNLNFYDFDERLQEFEENVHDEETFWAEAAKIDDPETQDLILNVLDELSIMDGYRGQSEKQLIRDLHTLWKK